MSVPEAPEGVRELLAVAQVARLAGDQGLVRRTLNEARQRFPESPEVHFAFGQDCLLDRDIDRARAAFARVVELDPTNVKAWINYGATCGEAEFAPEAARALERALELDPTSRDATSNLGVLRREAGRLGDAESLFRRVLALDPHFVLGYYNLAHCLFLAGRFEESAEQYREGLRRDPRQDPYQNGRLAFALLAGGRQKQARRELGRSLPRLPSDERHSFLVEADEILGALEAEHPGLTGLDSIRRMLAEAP